MKLTRLLLLFVVLSAVTGQAASTSSAPEVYFRGSADGSIVGRGFANTNASTGGVIAGGGTNRLIAPWSVIAGGRNNRILGSFDSNSVCVIGGGEDNVHDTNAAAWAGNWKGDNKHGVIAGGQFNTNNGGRYGTISGGWQNAISRSNTTIGGGWMNFINNWNSTIPGGYKNRIELTNAAAEAQQENNVIGGGYKNIMSGARASAIAGGYDNIMVVDSGVAPNNALLVGGAYNVVRGSGYGVLVGGIVNVLGIENGGGSYACFIGGGQTNGISAGSFNSIIGGYGNWIEGAAEYSFIGNGLFNTNASQLYHGVILSGAYNRIASGSTNGIIGGHRNMVNADNAWVLGNDITNETANSFETGFANRTKTRLDASGLTTLGSLTIAVTNKTTTYTATAADHVILCSASGGAFTLTLPAAAARKGQMLSIVKTDSSANAITVARAGSDTIQGPGTVGATSISLGIQNTNWVMYSDGGAAWYRYGSH